MEIDITKLNEKLTKTLYGLARAYENAKSIADKRYILETIACFADDANNLLARPELIANEGLRLARLEMTAKSYSI